MTAPFVGPPAMADEAAGCAYSADIDQPSCGQAVTVHVIGRAAGWGWVLLSTCDDHALIARASCAEVADVHPAEGCRSEHYVPTEPAR